MGGEKRPTQMCLNAPPTFSSPLVWLLKLVVPSPMVKIKLLSPTVWLFWWSIIQKESPALNILFIFRTPLSHCAASYRATDSPGRNEAAFHLISASNVTSVASKRLTTLKDTRNGVWKLELYDFNYNTTKN